MYEDIIVFIVVMLVVALGIPIASEYYIRYLDWVEELFE